MPDTLVDASTLAERLTDPDWAVVDCRHRLTDPAFGEAAYREAHIAGAIFAHADRVLSSAPVTDRGRHPLPDPETLRARFGALGIDSDTQVVAYDDAGGGDRRAPVVDAALHGPPRCRGSRRRVAGVGRGRSRNPERRGIPAGPHLRRRATA